MAKKNLLRIGDRDTGASIHYSSTAQLTAASQRKFLETTQRYPGNSSTSAQGRDISAVVKAVVTRGKAFTMTERNKIPDSVRLSMLPSNNTGKVSIMMLSQENSSVVTPWQGAVLRAASEGVCLSLSIVVPAVTRNHISVHIRPSYLRGRSELIDWGP
ncbi:hypothetical protein F5Y16DRAFT_423142 [Xylariaceae sp. FL0255]|nr:hypothetical protein F5Y16DRAFT_423142 [Xylariaceae sp. FL0255]